jgi:hypothetical protein
MDTVDNEVQFSKEIRPIQVTEFGIDTAVSEVQLSKAPVVIEPSRPMLPTFDGVVKVTEVMVLKSLNALLLISTTLNIFRPFEAVCGIVTFGPSVAS